MLGKSDRNGLKPARRRRTREQQTRETRDALIKAAVRAVARHGYAKASVARITEAAGVAQGTFYSYFDTHQQLLTELLPSEGIQLLDALGRAAHGAGDYFEHERRAFSAFFKYIRRYPHFLRVLTEAEIAAPDSYAQHMSNIEERYVSALQRAAGSGEIEKRSEKAFHVIAEVLAGARGHIAFGLSQQNRAEGEVPSAEQTVETFVKFLRIGLGESARKDKGKENGRAPAKRRRAPAAAPADTRELLLRTGARMVHEHGYEATTVARITDAANVAVGTFYAYFPSRQDLLDEVLIYVRREMLQHVRETARGSTTFLELEERGFEGFFDYLTASPAYIRIETEAAVWAKASYTRHFIDLERRYVAAMRRSKARGELTQYDEREFPVLAYIFMAARHYLSTRYTLSKGGAKKLPRFVEETYFDLVRRGLAAPK